MQLKSFLIGICILAAIAAAIIGDNRAGKASARFQNRCEARATMLASNNWQVVAIEPYFEGRCEQGRRLVLRGKSGRRETVVFRFACYSDPTLVVGDRVILKTREDKGFCFSTHDLGPLLEIERVH